MKSKKHALEEAIRIEAYVLSEKAGHPAGMEHAFWVQAEAAILAKSSGAAGKRPSRKMAVKKAKPKKPALKMTLPKKIAAKPEPAKIKPKAAAAPVIPPKAVAPVAAPKPEKPKAGKSRKP